MSDGPVSEQQAVTKAVTSVRTRLARVAGRALLRRRGWWALGAAAILAPLRPFLWPLRDEAPLYLGLVRAGILAGVGFACVASALVLVGRRRGPSALGAARAIDDALDLREVVGSGFAFESAGGDEAFVVLARRRAIAAVKGLDVDAAFPLPSLAPTRKRLAQASIGVAAALILGAYDPVLASALIAPPTEDERAAAADLDTAAQALAAALAPTADPKRPDAPRGGQTKDDERKGPRGAPRLVEKAREAAKAARRGDRQGALGKLDSLRTDGQKQATRAADLKAALRQIADALDPPKSGARSGAARALDPSAKAADSMRLLAKKMRSAEEAASETKESQERTLERLNRAGEEARKAGGEKGENGEKSDGKSAAESLSRAAEALSKGDREAAAKMLDQAAERADSLERERAEASAEAEAIAEMLEKSGILEEAIEMAMLGREGQGKPGEGLAMGEGNGGEGDKPGKGSGKGAGKKGLDLRRALASRLAAIGFGDESGTGTDGEGSIPDRHRTKREALEVKSSVRAPSEVGEGERAIQAIQGLGKGSEPQAGYREVFPSYDAAVEEGLADERIPAARRAAVRKYFQSIRPVDP
ncbi:MAG: hypothetical protein ABJE95_15645 [Byssovorax sp.]